jgi:hypothetical protein
MLTVTISGGLPQRYGKAGSSNRNGGDGDMDAGDPLLLSFHGTAAAYNKSLRKELLGMRSKRDLFLQSRRKILNPFLIEKVRPASFLFPDRFFLLAPSASFWL